MSGIDAMVAIRREFPKARIIILSTFEIQAGSPAGSGGGAKAYMLKSADPKDLAETIRRIHDQG